MKKTVCLMVAVVILFSFCSCGAKSYSSAIDALKDEGYHIEEISADYFGTDVTEGQAFAAMKGVPEKEWSDLDGDALYMSKEIVFAVYLENEKDTELIFNSFNDLTDDLNKYFENADKEAVDADGLVKKTFICEKKGTTVYFGTKEAVKLAK